MMIKGAAALIGENLLQKNNQFPPRNESEI